MFWHIETDIIGVALAIILLLRTRGGNIKAGDAHDKLFFFSECVAILAGVIDIASCFTLDYHCGRGITAGIMAAYYIVIYLPVVIWLFYSAAILFENDVQKSEKVFHIGIVPFIAYELLILINIWTGWIYSINEAGEYIHGELYNVPFILFTAYVISFNILVIANRKNLPSIRQFVMLLVAPNFGLIGIVLQLLMEGWLMIIPAYSLSLLLVYLFIEDDRACYVRDENQKIVSTLSQAASIDPLTGILNRGEAKRRIQEVLSNRENSRCLLIIADLDYLKTINDTYGHAQGDRVLTDIADTLKRTFRSTDVVARLGGDEFLVFLKNCGSDATVCTMLNMLVHKLASLRVGIADEATISCSLGAVLCITDGAADYDTLYHSADKALYHVKRNGKCNYALYTPQMERDDYQYVANAELPPSRSRVFDTEELQRLVYAISNLYSMIVSVDLLHSTYNIMKHVASAKDTLPLSGSFDELISTICAMYHPDDRSNFVSKFNKDSLIKDSRRNIRIIHFEGRFRHGSDYHWIETDVVFVPAAQGTDIYEIALSRPVGPERAEKLERQITSTAGC